MQKKRNKMKPTLLVLAAGMGSRYGGLKQVDPVGPSNEAIIDYSVFDAIRAGFGKIVFVIRKDIEDVFKEKISAKFADKIQVEYAFQQVEAFLPEEFPVPEGRTKPWGTGHAVLVAKDLIKEPFAVINADDFYGKESFELLGKYLSNAKDAQFADFSMVGFPLSNTLSEFGSVSRGVCDFDSNDNLKTITEKTSIEKNGNNGVYIENGEKIDLPGGTTVSMNMLGFTPVLFEHLEKMFFEFLKEQGDQVKSEFYIPSVVSDLISANIAKVKVLQTKSKWFGVTYQEDKPFVIDAVKKLVENGDYPTPLF